MEKSGTTTNNNISNKKRDNDPVRNKNGEEINKIKFSDDSEATSKTKKSEGERKSKEDGVVGQVGKENQINKPSDNTNITASPGEIVDDSRDIESEVDAKMRRDKNEKSAKNTASSKTDQSRSKSKGSAKEDKKQKTMEVLGGTNVAPTNTKETSSETKQQTANSGKSTSDTGRNSSVANRGGTNSSSKKGSHITMDYHEYSKDELYQRAQEIDLEGRSQMNKDELVKALYDGHTKEELHDRASEADISGRSKMSKTQLIKALQRTDHNKSSSGNNGSKNTDASSSSKSSGTDYHDLSRDELYEKAKQKDIEGRSQMSKDELMKALYADHTREDLYKKAARANISGRSKMSKKKLINELRKS